jgi:hypothetical protein
VHAARPDLQEQFIYLSRNSKLGRMFQDRSAVVPTIVGQAPPPLVAETVANEPGSDGGRTLATACSNLQSMNNPSLVLTRPMAASLMRNQGEMRCRVRGAWLDNEYVRDLCAARDYQRCLFLS